MRARVNELPKDPNTVALIEAVHRLGDAFGDIGVSEESVQDSLPSWLVSRLRFQAGVPEEEIDGLTLKEAVDLWTSWSCRQVDS